MVNAPEIKLKYRVEFAKDYLNRTPIDDHSVEPDILRIKVNDVDSVITCTELDSMMKVLIVGSRSGSIQAFYFAEEHMTTEDGEPSKLLKTPEGLEDIETKPVDDNLKIVLEARPSDFEAEIRTMYFIGHNNSVTSLSVNYDATYFVSGSVDQTIRLWSLKTGHCLGLYTGHLKTVWCVKLSSKGFQFVSGGADSMIFLWSTNKNAPLTCFSDSQKDSDVTHVEITDNLNYIVSASLDKALKIWNIETTQLTRVIFFDYPITA